MRLVSFSRQSDATIRPGLLQQNIIIDIIKANAIVALSVPHSIQDIIEQYETIRESLYTLSAAFQQGRLDEVSYPLTEVTLAAPIPHPRKNIMCLATNYTDHVKETAALREHGGTSPTQPVIFTKAPTTINSPYGEFTIDPAVSTAIDWEVELGVVIGKAGKNIREENAMHYVFGYTVLNDITARDLQTRHKQFFKGKSLDGSCPMGPCLVTADEIDDPHNLALQLRVNGEVKQDGNTKQMIFSIPDMIATLSLGMTLEAGDIIATGTPGGVGFSRQPPEFLKPGDRMESEITGIGMICTTIVGIPE